MTRTTVPATRPENPGGETPIEEPGRGAADKIAPPEPGVGEPQEAPIDPNRKPDRRPGDGVPAED